MKKVFKLTSERKVNSSRICVSRQASLALFMLVFFLHVPCCSFLSRITETERRNRFPVSTLHINSKSIMKKLRFEFEKKRKKIVKILLEPCRAAVESCCNAQNILRIQINSSEKKFRTDFSLAAACY